MPTKAELEAELEQVKQRNDVLRRQVEGFDTRLEAIGERAMELAEEHGWCGVISEALEEMMIPLPEKEVVITITLTGFTKSAPESLSTFARDSIRDHTQILDDDWSGVRINAVQAEVAE